MADKTQENPETICRLNIFLLSVFFLSVYFFFFFFALTSCAISEQYIPFFYMIQVCVALLNSVPLQTERLIFNLPDWIETREACNASCKLHRTLSCHSTIWHARLWHDVILWFLHFHHTFIFRRDLETTRIGLDHCLHTFPVFVVVPTSFFFLI